MKKTVANALHLTKAAVVVGTTLLAISGYQLWSQSQVIQSAQTQQSSATLSTEAKAFDAVSIKRSDGGDGRTLVQFQAGGRLVATNAPLRGLIVMAYRLPPGAGRSALIGAPDWTDSERYNIQTNSGGNPSPDQFIGMVQSMLADRFKLAVHWETRQLPVYALVVSKPGKLVTHAEDNSTCRDLRTQPLARPEPGSPIAPVPIPCGGFLISPGRLATSTTMANFAKNLSWFQQIDRSIVDHTGLTGTFDIALDYAPFAPGAPLGADPNAPDPAAPASIFTALQEQLGLKLEPTTGPVNILVIDHVEKPSEN